MRKVISSSVLVAMLSPAVGSAQEVTHQSLVDQVVELQSVQCAVHRDYAEMPLGAGDRRDAALLDLRARKDAMYDVLHFIEVEAGRMVLDTDTSAEVVERLEATTRAMARSRLKEMIQYSRGTIEQWDDESARTLESEIQDRLQGLRDALDPAATIVHCPEIG